MTTAILSKRLFQCTKSSFDQFFYRLHVGCILGPFSLFTFGLSLHTGPSDFLFRISLAKKELVTFGLREFHLFLALAMPAVPLDTSGGVAVVIRVRYFVLIVVDTVCVRVRWFPVNSNGSTRGGNIVTEDGVVFQNDDLGELHALVLPPFLVAGGANNGTVVGGGAAAADFLD